MVPLTLRSSQPHVQAHYTYDRRALLPLKPECLWQIQSGVVRSLTWQADGTPITLGLWGKGDVVGRGLSRAEPLQVECLTQTEAKLLTFEQWRYATELLILHNQRIEELLQIVHCRHVETSLLQLLSWLAQRFGQEVEQGQLIDMHLTHQEVAELIGSSRVTVTRLINEFEKQGIIQRTHRQLLLRQDQIPAWHYEI